jgi:hypothetical protein
VSVPFPRSRTAAVGLGALSLLALTGCDLPDVSMSPSVSTEAASSAPAAPAAVTTAAAAAVEPSRPSGDLDSGSLTRSLEAGSRSVVVDYWTDDDATTWTAADTKSVQISAHVESGDEDAAGTYGVQRLMKVTRFAATLDDGRTRSVVTEDRGEFAIMPPYSYTTALTLPPSPSATAELTLYVQFDLLVETEPGSEVFFRQTVLDTLRLPLSEESSP